MSTKVRVIGRLGLVGSQRVELENHGGVDCNLIVEQHADDMLDDVDRCGGKSGIRVVSFVILDTGTKDRAVTSMWGIFGAGTGKGLKFL